jgi:hypothetical protein
MIRSFSLSSYFKSSAIMKATLAKRSYVRFWVKKMFKLQVVGTASSEVRIVSRLSRRDSVTDIYMLFKCTKMICHDGKPVAIREKLFKVLSRAHQQCQHGGRDKTSAQVRQIYSWYVNFHVNVRNIPLSSLSNLLHQHGSS